MKPKESQFFDLTTSKVGDYWIGFCEEKWPYGYPKRRYVYEPKHEQSFWTLIIRSNGGYTSYYCRNLWWAVFMRYGLIRKLFANL